MSRIPAREAKDTKLTREEILESMGWESHFADHR